MQRHPHLVCQFSEHALEMCLLVLSNFLWIANTYCCLCSYAEIHLVHDLLHAWPANSGMGGHDTESKWGLPEVVVMIRRTGEESQVGVIREAMMVSSSL